MRFLIWHPDNYLEIASVTKNETNDRRVRLETQTGTRLAKLCSDGNGFTFKSDDIDVRLSYADADYLFQMLKILNKLSGYVEAQHYELKA